MHTTPFDHSQAESLIRAIDGQFHQQRCQLLALDTPLTVLLPQHLLGLPVSGAVKYISRRLLFSLVNGADTPACTSRSLLWLEGCIDYLFCCNPDERTFYYLIRLTQLPLAIRSSVFESHFPDKHSLRSDKEMPDLLNDLEVVAVLYLSSIGKFKEKGAK